MLPGLNFLFAVKFGVCFDAVGAQRFEALDVDTEVGELLSRVFEAL
mgnify:CR=1 FL=1